MPSQTEKNPKENVKAIVLRSGKEVRVDKGEEPNVQQGEMPDITHEEAPKYVPPHARQSEKTETSNNQADPSINKEAESSVHEAELKMKNLEYKTLPPPTFPKQFNMLLDVFNQHRINIPLIDALQSMPSR